MRKSAMKKLTKHFDTYFHQDDCIVIHPNTKGVHIDALLYSPTDKYPFWKMVTMGASDYKMPAPKNALSAYNEYIMFLDPNVDMRNKSVAIWYFNKLLGTAYTASEKSRFLSIGSAIAIPDDGQSDMTTAFIWPPMVIKESAILKCKLGFWKTVACLQVIFLTEAEAKGLDRMNRADFGASLYLSDGRLHFICEQYRSDKL